jgi:hypothetical protein
MVQTAKEGMMNNATSSEVYGKMQDVFIKMDHGGDVSIISTTSYYITKALLVVVVAYQMHPIISDDRC